MTQILIEKLKTLFIRINIILRRFAKCTRLVKWRLFRSYCLFLWHIIMDKFQCCVVLSLCVDNWYVFLCILIFTFFLFLFLFILFLWYFLRILWSDSNKDDDDDDDIGHVTLVIFILSTCNSCVLEGQWQWTCHVQQMGR